MRSTQNVYRQISHAQLRVSREVDRTLRRPANGSLQPPPWPLLPDVALLMEYASRFVRPIAA
ncbi:MAG TPA: hypothetical protein VJT50_02220 [Pyrinomonadaceae bacterium]|nr:hypothetical protein [Pyrinomonadaceae bacterium]